MTVEREVDVDFNDRFQCPICFNGNSIDFDGALDFSVNCSCCDSEFRLHGDPEISWSAYLVKAERFAERGGPDSLSPGKERQTDA